jgi:ubiquinone/menaquinone biosynthesis C-methylase UbiE
MTTTAPLVRNYWTDAKCAKAFWGQQELPAYRELLKDTLDWAAPAAGECWLDLGCGGGTLTRALWEKSAGEVAEVVGVDCAGANALAYERLRASLRPDPPERIRFVCHDFSSGCDLFPDRSFDHAVSGLSISYAESYDERNARWTKTAYDRVLSEVHRVLRPGGRFVFSVNVPEPSWGKVGLRSVLGYFKARKPLRLLKQSWRMMRYGAWLKREARLGRFHYLPHQEVTARLRTAGFADIEVRTSYAGQAYVFRAVRPVQEQGKR